MVWRIDFQTYFSHVALRDLKKKNREQIWAPAPRRRIGVWRHKLTPVISPFSLPKVHLITGRTSQTKLECFATLDSSQTRYVRSVKCYSVNPMTSFLLDDLYDRPRVLNNFQRLYVGVPFLKRTEELWDYFGKPLLLCNHF